MHGHGPPCVVDLSTVIEENANITISCPVEWNSADDQFRGKFIIRLPTNEKKPISFVVGSDLTTLKLVYHDLTLSSKIILEKPEHEAVFLNTDKIEGIFTTSYLAAVTLLVGSHTLILNPIVQTSHHLFVVKCKIRTEKQIVQELERLPPEDDFVIAAIFPTKKNTRNYLGYWCLETTYDDPKEISKRLRVLGIPHKILGGLTDYTELFQYAETSIQRETTLEVGNIVLILVKPFKNEKAQIIEFVPKDERKVVVQLLTTGLPVPITLDKENIRLLEVN